MLSDPNVKKIMPKAGNRYEAALAIAKRARDIAQKRYEEGSTDIKDPVDVASCEIAEEKVFVKKDGKYVVEPKFEKYIHENETNEDVEKNEENEVND